jgi:hypothetical protein
METAKLASEDLVAKYAAMARAPAVTATVGREWNIS